MKRFTVKCPKCGGVTKVVDSLRVDKYPYERFRNCIECEHEFMTVEIYKSEYEELKYSKK